MSESAVITRLLDSSRKVFQDCQLENGGIVAAPSHMPYFPKEAKNYFFVWPRDALFICRAASRLGLNLHDGLFEWAVRAEGWAETGLFFEKYNANGNKARHEWQPDQTGSVLLAIQDRYPMGEMPPHVEHLLTHSANGLCARWNGKSFDWRAQDLWEERFASADYEQNFTYSIAACARGLMAAYQLRGNERWREVAEQMIAIIDGFWTERFGRTSGRLPDRRIDGSLVGLAYPFRIIDASDPRMTATIDEIMRRLWADGVMRYEGDDYDGHMYADGYHRKNGAGHWPLLTLWLAITHAERGEMEKAFALYNHVLSTVPESGMIAEQVFDNDIQVAVSPLAWSHAMFVLATEALGLMPETYSVHAETRSTARV